MAFLIVRGDEAQKHTHTHTPTREHCVMVGPQREDSHETMKQSETGKMQGQAKEHQGLLINTEAGRGSVALLTS